MSKNERFTVKQFTDRLFVPVYHDFLDSTMLSGKEKIVFIMLKRYLTFGNDEGEVYPTIETLCNQCDMSKPTVIKILKQLEKKGVLKIEQRGLNKPNLYTLYDLKDVWNANSKKEIIEAINNSEDERLADILRAKGYHVSKEKEVVPATDQSTGSTSQLNSSVFKNNTTTEQAQSQEFVYTREIVDNKYNYEILLKNNKADESLIDGIMALILEVLNSNKLTIKVNEEDRPAHEVKKRFSELNYTHIQHVIDKVAEQTNIYNPRNWLISCLFNAYTTIDVHYSTIVNKNNK